MKKVSKEVINYALTGAELILAKLTQPNTWTKCDFAVDAQGYSVSADDPRAVKWCLDGFIQKVSISKEVSDLLRLETEKEIKARCHISLGIPHYNDNHAEDKFDIMAVMSEVRQALYQRSLPWYNWYKWMPRRCR